MAANKINAIRGKAVVVRGNEIDTDRIIPARFMKCVTFEGLGEYAFYDERYDSVGMPQPHPFNDEQSKDASILLVNKNFGCGSSREHAPQALARWGIRAIVGESFAEIFAGNCTSMGIPAVVVSEADIEKVQKMVEENPAVPVTVDIDQLKLTVGDEVFSVDTPASSRNSLLSGAWDEADVLLANARQIESVAQRLPYIGGY